MRERHKQGKVLPAFIPWALIRGEGPCKPIIKVEIWSVVLLLVFSVFVSVGINCSSVY